MECAPAGSADAPVEPSLYHCHRVEALAAVTRLVSWCAIDTNSSVTLGNYTTELLFVVGKFLAEFLNHLKRSLSICRRGRSGIAAYDSQLRCWCLQWWRCSLD